MNNYIDVHCDQHQHQCQCIVYDNYIILQYY